MSHEWNVVYWSEEDGQTPVEEWLDELGSEQIKAIAKELALLKICGNQLRIPHSKALEGGLFELREMRFGLRVYYGFNKGKIIILLAAGDKSSQKRDIKTARERLTKMKEC
jgi:putative addiction module killer protein